LYSAVRFYFCFETGLANSVGHFKQIAGSSCATYIITNIGGVAKMATG